MALSLAESEFEKYRIIQDKLMESDFDKAIKKLASPLTENKKRKKMSNNTSSIVSKVWSFCNPLRDVGVGYGDYLEQLTYLLF